MTFENWKKNIKKAIFPTFFFFEKYFKNPNSDFTRNVAQRDKKKWKNCQKVEVNNLAGNGQFYQILLKMCSFVS